MGYGPWVHKRLGFNLMTKQQHIFFSMVQVLHSKIKSLMKYLALPIKRNEFESVIERWMNLEPIYSVKWVRKIKTNIPYECISMESRKMVLMKLFAEQQ